MKFVIIYRPGPAWEDGKDIFDQQLDGHEEYIHGLFLASKVRMGGPFTDNAGGLALIDVQSEQEAIEIIDNDPAVARGVFSTELHPYHIVFPEANSKLPNQQPHCDPELSNLL
jgi:uncharacterized protein YciI